MQYSSQNFQRILFLVVGLLTLCTSSTTWLQKVAAQETSSTTVTATVVDDDRPSTPVLISPSNNSLTTTNKPQFVWQRATDTVGIEKYQLFLNGSVVFDNIPETATENSDYVLLYDSVNDYLKLTPKTARADGIYTWKIRVFDTSDNSTDSVTWTVTIDTQAPSFVITTLANLSTSISAQDSSTIPTTPLVIATNEPTISGTGEVGSSVTLLVTIPSQGTQNYAFTIGSGGTWSVTLGLLPRDVEISLDFTIIDSAGNVSILQDVEFILPTPTIIIIPGGTPTPTPTPLITPEPTVPAIIEQTPTPSPTPLPTTTPTPTPILEIPFLPPREVAQEVTQAVSSSIPESITNLWESIPEPIQDLIQTPINALGPTAALTATALVPGLSFLSLIWDTAGNLSFRVLTRILQAIGLFPKSNPQGLVFNTVTNEPIPFAVITISQIVNSESDQAAEEIVVTDVDGVYQGVSLATGRYKLKVTHPDFSFPVTRKRAAWLSLHEYYQGEEFEITQGSPLLFLIPMEPKSSQETTSSWKRSLKLFISRWKMKDMVYPLALFTLIITLLYPTLINGIILVSYGLVISYRLLSKIKTPSIQGTVLDQSQLPLSFVTVRMSDSQTNELRALLSTDKNGYFSADLPISKYQLQLTKTGYLWDQQLQSMSTFEVDLTKQKQNLKLSMKKISN